MGNCQNNLKQSSWTDQTTLLKIISRLPGKVSFKHQQAYRNIISSSKYQFKQLPQYIVSVSNQIQLTELLSFSKKSKLPILEPRQLIDNFFVDKFIMLNTKELNNVQYTPGSSIVKIDRGAQWSQLFSICHKYRLLTTFCQNQSKNIFDDLIAGKVGFFSRKKGLGIQNMTSIDLIAYDGTVLSLSNRNNRQIYNAIRNGDLDLGIVSRFQMRLQNLQEIYGGFLCYSEQMAYQVFRFFKEWAAVLPKQMTCSISIVKLYQSKYVKIKACFLGNSNKAKRLIQVWCSWNKPLRMQFSNLGLHQYNQMFGSQNKKEDSVTLQGGWLQELQQDNLQAILDFDDEDLSFYCNQIIFAGGSKLNQQNQVEVLINANRYLFMWHFSFAHREKLQAVQLFKEIREKIKNLYVSRTIIDIPTHKNMESIRSQKELKSRLTLVLERQKQKINRAITRRGS